MDGLKLIPVGRVLISDSLLGDGRDLASIGTAMGCVKPPFLAGVSENSAYVCYQSTSLCYQSTTGQFY